MVSLVATRLELELMKAVIDKTAQAVFTEKGRTVEYLVGTMIALPRAALQAGEIAQVGEFFSFGTNPLTHTPLLVSPAYPTRFLPPYFSPSFFFLFSLFFLFFFFFFFFLFFSFFFLFY